MITTNISRIKEMMLEMIVNVHQFHAMQMNM